ncbi:MAG: hypothetical protein JWM90_2898 [Thermoleophilia bacterium]|nr:hypothetical protein [Thermoleophilia bacterium]
MQVHFVRRVRNACLLTACAIGALAPASAVAAQAPVGLGTAGSYAVLAGTTVTNTGATVINGDLGLSPGTSITGFPPGTVNGTIHATDAAAAQAQADLTTAYDDAAGRSPAIAVSGDLGGLTVTGGVYRSASSVGLTGTLTLDAQGDPNTVFVFQAGSALTTATSSRVRLINGAQSCNVFWNVGSSATLGTSSTFVGNLLALTSVSLNDSVTVSGRVLARNGAVTLLNDTISASACATPPPGGTTGGTGGTGGGGTTRAGTAILSTTPPAIGRHISTYGASRCVNGSFRALVRGVAIRRVVFTINRKVVANRTAAPFAATVPTASGMRVLLARVTFSDGTTPVTLTMRFRTCESRRARPSLTPIRPPGFTG